MFQIKEWNEIIGVSDKNTAAEKLTEAIVAGLVQDRRGEFFTRQRLARVIAAFLRSGRSVTSYIK